MNREKHTRKLDLAKTLLVLYILFLVCILILKYPLYYLVDTTKNWGWYKVMQGLSTANFVPFKTMRIYFRNYRKLNSFLNLFGNVLAFVPYGVFVCGAARGKITVLRATAWGFFCSFWIEFIQLVTCFGAFDVDDLILNTLGAMIGCISWKMVMGILKRREGLRCKK